LYDVENLSYLRFTEEVFFPAELGLPTLHKIAALAFLKPDDVVKGYEDLSLDLDDEYQTILDYFEEIYIGK